MGLGQVQGQAQQLDPPVPQGNRLPLVSQEASVGTQLRPPVQTCNGLCPPRDKYETKSAGEILGES